MSEAQIRNYEIKQNKMNNLVKVVVCSVLMCLMFGCASRQNVGGCAVTSSGEITVNGFVKTPGKYPFHEDITVADALRLAGGYGRCSSCEEFFRENGWHPTFDNPPKIQRAGEYLKLPTSRAEWMKFDLMPNDLVHFRHIMW